MYNRDRAIGSMCNEATQVGIDPCSICRGDWPVRAQMYCHLVGRRPVRRGRCVIESRF